MLLMHIGRLALHLHSIGDFDAALPLKQEHRRLALGIDRPEASALGLAFYRDALPVKTHHFFLSPKLKNRIVTVFVLRGGGSR